MREIGEIKGKPPILVVKDLSLNFDEVMVLKDLNLTLFEGEIMGLLGESGCGKTTLLRSIAGFQNQGQGEIYLNDEELSQRAIYDRGIGFVFQDLSLFPHMSVEDNIKFGLHRVSAEVRKKRLVELLEIFGLNQLSQRFPHELSGGQQQRVALARSMAPKPSLILMDEPFSALDSSLREPLIKELRSIIKEQGQTLLFVTHSREELFQLADRGGILIDGHLHQVGTLR